MNRGYVFGLCPMRRETFSSCGQGGQGFPALSRKLLINSIIFDQYSGNVLRVVMRKAL
ncbi:MAG: hypothetical protein V7K27_08555 [Nostoc sp.]|uniref:hypothetical protein n=1 Tax=Nostoc sp. TaxID=1180 RepID=UPI002FF46EE8